MHENIRGEWFCICVLATSGTTGAEGERISSTWKFAHLAEAFSTQWCDAALAARDAKARKSLKQWWQQWTILTCLDSQRPRLASILQFPGTTNQ